MALVRGTARDKRGGSKHEREKDKDKECWVGVVERQTTGRRRDGKTKAAERNGEALVNLLTCH